MRLLVTIAAVALLGATALSFAQDKATTKDDAGPPCDGSTADMVECFVAKTARWDKRLNAAYARVLKETRAKQKEQLRVAQRLWVQYRDANCRYYGMGEGTVARLVAVDCEFRMTRERAQELEAMADSN